MPRSRITGRSTWRAACWGALALGGLSCGEGPAAPAPAPPGTCLEDLSLDCRPLYDPPSFPVIFDKIIRPTCAQGLGTCHTSDGAMAGLIFEEEEDAYTRLLGEGGGRARVLPGDPACSLLLGRLSSNDPQFRMPPGPTSLSLAEICDITLWIARGASREGPGR